MPLDPIRDALAKAEDVVENALANESFAIASKKLTLAAMIAATNLNRDIVTDIRMIAGEHPELLPQSLRAPVAPPKPPAAPAAVKDMDSAVQSAYDEDVLRQSP